MSRAIVNAMGTMLLTSLLTCCTVAPSPPPTSTPTVRPTPTPRQTDSLGKVIDQVAGDLLATLPERAGGVQFDWVQVIVDDYYLWGHAVDDVLRAVGKERPDAVAVFRYSEVTEATIGATTVEGIDGQTLLQAFADTWHAPAVIHRSTRMVGGSNGWEIWERGGNRTVVYLSGDVVYLTSAPDRATLDAILAEMPPPLQ